MSKSYSGLLLVNKPQGITSHDVVYKVRKKLGIKSVGHTGTLDPFASGLMTLVVGQATKLSKYFLSGDKGYKVTIKLGQETTTWDREGGVVCQTDAIPNESTIRQALINLLEFDEMQIPPYSAKKVNGKKLYELAREGKEVPVLYKPMKFWDMQNIKIKDKTIELQFFCSKGSFVRSFAQELGKHLGCGAFVESLERTYSQPYTLDKAVALEDICPQSLDENLISMEDLFEDWPMIQLTNSFDSKLMLNGQVPESIVGDCLKLLKNEDQRLKVTYQGKLSSILYLNPKKQIRIDSVFSGC